MSKKDKNIILDIDGTLIDSVPADYAIENNLPKPDIVSPWGDFIYKRPHLDDFLKYCHMNFKNVAIWTAGDDAWADLIVSKILDPSLASSKKGKRLVSSAGCTPISSPIRRRPILDEIELKSDSSDESTDLESEDECEIEEPNTFSFVYSFERCKPIIIKDRKTDKSYQYYSKPLKKIWKCKTLRSMGFTRQTTLILEDTPENCVDNYGNAIYISSYDITTTKSRFDTSLLKIQGLFENILPSNDLRIFEKRGWEKKFSGFSRESLISADKIFTQKSISSLDIPILCDLTA